jgi:hypothetical protein
VLSGPSDLALESAVAVTVAGRSIPEDDQDGWSKTGPNISLHGAACEARRAGGDVVLHWADECVRAATSARK